MRFAPRVVAGFVAAVAPAASHLAEDAAFPRAEDAVPELRVMTYNIRGDFDGGQATDNPGSWLAVEGRSRRDLVIEVIRGADPDILGVQEAYRNQMDDLRRALPGHDSYGVGRDDGVDAGEFSGIFFRSGRFTAEQRGTFWLSREPEDPGSKFPGAATVRIASWVVLRDAVAGHLVFTLNTHWDHVSQAAREAGATLIRRKLDRLPPTQAILVMGDLNADEDNPAFNRLVAAGAAPGSRSLIDSYRSAHPQRAFREATANGFVGQDFGTRIDHILHSDDVETLDSQIDRTDFNGRLPSDHFPVTSRLRLTAAAPD